MRPAFLRHLPLTFFLLAGGSIAALWLLRKALAPFFIAMVLSYLLAPLVDRCAKRIPRSSAVISVILGATLSALGALWFLVPRILLQMSHLKASIPVWKVALENRVGPWLQANPEIGHRLKQTMEGIDPMTVLKGIGGASLGLLEGFLTALSLLLVPLIVYYLLLEGRRLIAWADAMVPARHREKVRTLASVVHLRLGGYIRGQLAVAVVMSLLQSLGYLVLGVPYGWLLGIIAGFSNVVPYSPYITSLPAALVLAGIEGGSWGRLLLIQLVFTLIQKAETLYFTPVWVGRATHLHPLEVLLAILAFGSVFGILGLIFAVPLMIVLKAVGEMVVAEYRRHAWYTGEP